MKYKAIVFVTLTILCAMLLAVSTPLMVTTNAGTADPKAVTLLLLGVDHAANNSDVVLLARYDRIQKRTTLMQLPRDTYLEI